MAEAPIKGSELIESGALDSFINDTKQLNAQLEETNKQLGLIAQQSQKAAKGLSASKAGDMQKAVALNKEMTATLINQEKVQQAKIKTEKALIQLSNAKEKQQRKEQKQQEQLTNAYKRESKQLNDLRNAYKNLAAQNQQNTKEAKNMLKEITRLDTKLKAIDASVGQNQRSVGNYQKALGGLGKNLKGLALRFVAFTAIVSGLSRVLKGAFNTFKEFQQANANLAAILGKSRGDIKKLTEDAKRLGATTAFTASQVTQLQIEFSKLGFKEEEILAATEATLDLAAATGTDLAEAATVAASTVNGFGLGAEETQRIVDVMAKSFSSSALDMQKFSTAMATVAPVAKSAGVSVERTTALLGTLVDAGVDASTAGTGLRNIFLDLAKSGKTFEEAMLEINNSTNKNATAMDLFGKRGATVATVLADNTEKADELSDAFQRAGGSAQEMADTQLDTLQGSITKLGSAWEGFILSIESGDGVISRALMSAIELGTEFLGVLTKMNMSSAEIAKQNLGGEFDKGISNANEKMQSFNETLQLSDKDLGKLNTRYSEFVETLRTEGVTDIGNQELLSIIRETELATEDLLKLQKEETKVVEETNKLYQDINETIEENGQVVDGQLARQKLQMKNNADLIDTGDGLSESIHQLNGELETYNKQLQILIQNKTLEELVNITNDAAITSSDYGRQLQKLAKAEIQRRKDLGENIDLIDQQTDATKSNTDATNKNNEAKQKQLELLRKIKEEQQRLNDEEKVFQFLRDQNQTEFENELDDIITQYDKLFELARDNADLTLQLEEQLQEDITALYARQQKEREDLLKSGSANQAIKDAIKTEEDFLETFKSLSEQLVDLTTWATDRRIEELDRLNDAEQRKYDEAVTREQQIIDMRNNGAANTEESLAFERKAQAEALAEQEKIARRKQRLELITASINLFNNQVQAGNGNPLAGTIGDISSLVGFLNSLPAFWEGTDTTVGDKLGSKVSSGRDGILARVDKDEIILNKEKSDKLRGMTTDDITRAALMYKHGAYDSSIIFRPKKADTSDSETLSEMREMNRHLANISNKPNKTIGIEEVAGIVKINERVITNRKTVTRSKFLRLGK